MFWMGVGLGQRGVDDADVARSLRLLAHQLIQGRVLEGAAQAQAGKLNGKLLHLGLGQLAGVGPAAMQPGHDRGSRARMIDDRDASKREHDQLLPRRMVCAQRFVSLDAINPTFRDLLD